PSPHSHTLSLHDALPISLQLVHENLHLLQHFFAGWPPPAGGVAVPLDVDHRRQRALDLRNVADEPVGLLAGGTAPVEEMVGASRSEEHTSELQSLRHLVC